MYRIVWMAACSILVASPALAEPSASAVKTAPVAEASSADRAHRSSVQEPRSGRSGFYLRGSVGGGVIGVSLNPEPGYPEHDDDEAGVSAELLAGGSFFRGVALGGALLLDLAPSMDLGSRNLEGADAPVGILLLGPFVDAFPDPESGWHFGGTLGFAGASLQTVDSSHHRLAGFGGAIWAGNDFVASGDFRVGARLRLVHTQTRGDAGEVDLNASTLAAALMLTAAHY